MMSSGKITLYQIEVKSQGSRIAQHRIKAANALAAINRVERYYGEPVKVETIWVENEDGSRRQVMVANNWHGYTFDARVVTEREIR